MQHFFTKMASRFSSLQSGTYKSSLQYLERSPLLSTDKTVVLMLNLGGPNNPDEVSPFLVRFFTDDTVIRIPYGLGPYIARLRGPAKINKQYAAIGGHSPILNWTIKQAEGLRSLTQDTNTGVLPAFRYGLPLQEDAIEYAFEKTEGKLTEIVLFSQYPQYSCATGGNAMRFILKTLKKYKEAYKDQPFNVKIIDQWHKHPQYIETLSTILAEDIRAKGFDPKETKILFTAHSLPANFFWDGDRYPYYIYETCQMVQDSLKQKGIDVTFQLAYQSKVGFQTWVQPSIRNALNSLIIRPSTPSMKNIVISPIGFTSDHLETLYELDQELMEEVHEIAIKHKKTIHRARSLNDHPGFLLALSQVLSEAQAKESKGRRSRCYACKFEDCDIVNHHTL